MITKIKNYLNEQKPFYVLRVIQDQQIREILCFQHPDEVPSALCHPDILTGIATQRTLCVPDGNRELFLECVRHNPQLYIFGAGTLAKPLCTIATMVGFEVTIIDDRAEFANTQRFPDASHVLCQDMVEYLSTSSIPDDAYYVLVTRGHQMDETCLRAILHKGHYAYLGMIGSRRKASLLKNNLLKEGISEDVLNGIHAPIGLPIHSHTPEEIAVSICAELIQVKNAQGTYEGDRECWRQLKEEPMVMATILEHHGSTPRGIGSKMIINKDGSYVGTIGGGSLEYQTIAMAKTMMHDNKAAILDFNLSNADASKEGMICGGSARVVLEPIALFKD